MWVIVCWWEQYEMRQHEVIAVFDNEDIVIDEVNRLNRKAKKAFDDYEYGKGRPGEDIMNMMDYNNFNYEEVSYNCVEYDLYAHFSNQKGYDRLKKKIKILYKTI